MISLIGIIALLKFIGLWMGNPIWLVFNAQSKLFYYGSDIQYPKNIDHLLHEINLTCYLFVLKEMRFFLRKLKMTPLMM